MGRSPPPVALASERVSRRGLLIRVPAVAVLIAATLALAGCGERRGSVKVEGGGTDTAATSTSGTATSGAGAPATATPPAPSGPVVATVRVAESEFRLAPSGARVARPGVVRVVARNAGAVAHAIEVEGPGGEVRSGTIAPGRSATIRVDLSKRGSYIWYCPVDGHRGRGMRGTITVGKAPGGGSQDGGGSSGGAVGPAGRGY